MTDKRSDRSDRQAARLIIVLAKPPRPGAVKTRLQPALSPHAAAELAHAFLQDSLNLVTAPATWATDRWLALEPAAGDNDPLPVPDNLTVIAQCGNSLTERLVNVFEEGFAAGHQSVCVIGSDTPHLPPAFIAEAFGRLESGGADVVIGPAIDGGYYLIGLRAPRPALFSGISWSQETVLNETLQRAAAADLTTHLLPIWYDIDEPADLARLRRDLRRGVVSAPVTAASFS